MPAKAHTNLHISRGDFHDHVHGCHLIILLLYWTPTTPTTISAAESVHLYLCFFFACPINKRLDKRIDGRVKEKQRQICNLHSCTFFRKTSTVQLKL